MLYFFITAPNCDSVRCTVPECSNGILMTLSGECCQRCIPLPTVDKWLCEFIPCDEPQCPPHQKPFTPDGACCPECRQDCSLVACDDPLCRHGLEPYKSCCPTCLDFPMRMKAQNTLAVGNAGIYVHTQ